MARLIPNNTSKILYYRAEDGQVIDTAELSARPPWPSREDVDRHLANGLFVLRRPGTYLPIAGICALPPRTQWWMTNNVYKFAGDLRPPRAKTGTVEAALDYGRRLLVRMGRHSRLGVELSGGLDSSIVIEFLLRQGVPVSLIAFTSKRYEFRTERAIQSHYEQRCSSVHLIPYEESPAFSQLEEVPPHPFPAQESLFFARHRAAAKACHELGIDVLFSGEAGDQLLGFEPERCDAGGRAPAGYAYWNLAELWSHQHVHIPQGNSYVSAIALGRLPSMILQARSSLGPDHMKLWIRHKLRDYLPPMLTEYAYKAFHDGWVIDGLIAASRAIRRMSKCAYEITRHPELEPGLMEASSKQYRVLNEKDRTRFLARLSFVTWVYSNHRPASEGHA
jgi:asparagine synthetase B (glutamine-hydrolysing)